MSEYIIRPYDSADNASLAAAIPVMGEKSGRSRDFAIAQGALRGKTDAIWKSWLQNGNCWSGRNVERKRRPMAGHVHQRRAND